MLLSQFLVFLNIHCILYGIHMLLILRAKKCGLEKRNHCVVYYLVSEMPSLHEL